MGLIADIQQDVINSSLPLTPTLRKAQILAYQLDNQEFKTWVEWELSGYSKEGEDFDNFIARLPTYRWTYAEQVCDAVTHFYRGSNIPVQLPDNMPDVARRFWFVDGIPILEKLVKEEGTVLREPWPDFMVNFVNNNSADPRMRVTQGWKQVPKTFVVHIIETVRGRLLKFTLELKQAYPELDKDIDSAQAIISRHQVENLVYNHILVHEGGNVSTFDQRGQTVSGNQYNAANDINFNEIASPTEFASALQSLKAEVEQLDLDEDTATDVEYHLTKAIQQTQKPEPQKRTILSHLNQVKSLGAKITGMAGFIITLDKAIAVIDKIF